MPSFLGEETSLFVFDELSGQLIDKKPAGKDSTTVTGSPVGNGETISYTDPDDHRWSVTNQLIDQAGGDGTLYFKGKLQGALNGVTKQIFRSWTDFNNGPLIHWNDDTVANSLGVFRYANDTNSGEYFNIGRKPDPTENLYISYSIDESADTIYYVIKSDHPTDPLDLSGSKTLFGRNNTNSGHIIFLNTTGEGDQLGALDGSLKSIQDMQDTGDVLLPAPKNLILPRRKGLYLFDSSPRG